MLDVVALLTGTPSLPSDVSIVRTPALRVLERPTPDDLRFMARLATQHPCEMEGRRLRERVDRLALWAACLSGSAEGLWSVRDAAGALVGGLVIWPAFNALVQHAGLAVEPSADEPYMGIDVVRGMTAALETNSVLNPTAHASSRGLLLTRLTWPELLDLPDRVAPICSRVRCASQSRDGVARSHPLRRRSDT